MDNKDNIMNIEAARQEKGREIVIAPQPVPARMSAAEIRQHVNVVQEVMRAVMKRETHYGIVPGTNKPTLYKAGAEVLCMTFRIADKYQVEDLSTPDMVRYRVTCIGEHQVTGAYLGSGVGEASTGEEKYKWRSAVCDEEWDETPVNLRRIKYGKKRDGHYKVKQIRTEPADLANTVLKMANKRAKIAMTLNVTAASDMFTQDIEDLPEELREHYDEPVPQGDPELLERWVNKAREAKDAAELAALWAEGVKAIKDAKDMPAYTAFKAEVEKRGKAFKEQSSEGQQ